MVQLEHVIKEFAMPSGEATVVLRDVSMQVKTGDAVAIVGPSGSGKSTLLNIIGGLDSPTSGRVVLNGRDLAGLPEKELARIRSRDIGFVFQLHHLLPQLTVLENVLLPTLALNEHADAAERAKTLLDRVGLAERMNYMPAQLSGGERQRAAVVRALINKPGLLLADEPTGSLDQAASDTLAQVLAQLNDEENVALILVTHSLDLAKKMRTVYQLIDGRLAQG